ncbi:septum formation family protein [Micromonospora sp. SH-82]|uniref:septum formation family protein n=1 Tax=Micromonospora sp. SH-82 TaxID=3132938 RepID=UPI003EB8119A
MRSARRAVLATVVATVVLTGCAATVGDGDLVDDWGALPAPTPFTPAAEVCHPGDFTDVVGPATYQPVDCAVPHRLETVHVGTFTANRPEPPTVGSVELRGAFAECDVRATGYLGDEWRGARLRLGVALPSAVGWGVGARWFRCDLTELTTVEAAGDPVTRTTSLRGALRGPSPLRLGCQQASTIRGGRVTGLTPVTCDKRHNAEYAGVFRAPETPYPTRDRDWAPVYTGCRSVLARYAGVPEDRLLPLRTDVVVRPPSAGRWRAGDRGVRCYLWLSQRSVSGSLKGVGTAGLPPRTR